MDYSKASIKTLPRMSLKTPRAFSLFLIGLVLMLLSVNGVGARVGVTSHDLQRVFATIGTGVAFLSGVTLFFSGDGKNPIGYLLLEHNALSLGRTQFFLWLLPAVCIYGGLLLPDLKLVDFPPELLPILGGSLATALVGGAMAPSQATVAVLDAAENKESLTMKSEVSKQMIDSITKSINQSDLTDADKQQAHEIAKKESGNESGKAAFADQGVDAAPSHPDFRLISLVQDFKSQGDITRYQLLFLTALGSFVLLAGFLTTGHVLPDGMNSIPTGLLQLMGGSAVGYLATKGIKTVTVTNEVQSK